MTPSQASPSPLSPWSPGTKSIPTQTTTDNTRVMAAKTKRMLPVTFIPDR